MTNQWKNIKKSIKNIFLFLMKYVKIIISIGSVIGFFFFFRYIGFKGFIGFVVGLFFMAILLLSKNSFLKFLIDFANAEDYLYDVGKKDEKRK